ncbi:MAG TPA: methyltransferase domain-containing protein [Thermoleophilia bacterium]|nr:methyltransferase domain-containing protein [Thermoleophilia bacterium]
MDARFSTPPGGHAVVYDALMWPLERTALGAWRRRLAAGARGRVLEIGTGTGAQLAWYAPGTRVTALEPDAGMLARARRRATRAAASVTVVEGRAEELPFADAGFDAAVSAFALCTVADPAAALAEVRRVLVPGGTLQLLEHVHLPWEPGRALQSRAAPAWASVAGGCRLDRDTLRSAREAGFVVVSARTHVAGWVVQASLRAPSTGA